MASWLELFVDQVSGRKSKSSKKSKKRHSRNKETHVVGPRGELICKIRKDGKIQW